MKGIDLISIAAKLRFKSFVGGFCGQLFFDQSESAGDSMYVCVHGQSWHAKTEEQDTRGCFRTDTVKRGQLTAGFGNTRPGQSTQVERSKPLPDCRQYSLDPWRFLIREPAASDRIGHSFIRRVDDQIPGWECRAK
jgi:hypothetical protein